MNEKQLSRHNQIEINDLEMIKESVANAIERRKYTSDLIELSDTEINKIIGGDDHSTCTQQTMGFVQDQTSSIDVFL